MSQNPQDPRAIARKKRQAKALKANMQRRKMMASALDKTASPDQAKKDV